jgi:hypothetical protein
MEQVIKGVTLYSEMQSKSESCRRNMETIVEFFSLYLKDKEKFYSLWCADQPQVVTPFTSNQIAVCNIATQSGWDAVKAFWDPIFDEMEGRFDWFIDEFIPGENPDVIVTRSHSNIDVKAGATWGNRTVKYEGRYIQVFRFVDGKIKCFEEYYDTALLNAKYGG